MRKMVAYLFLIGFLNGYTNLVELLKLPRLMSHYFLHEIENPNLNILDFLHNHYCELHFACDDAKGHCDLPFQSCDFHPIQVISPTVLLLPLERPNFVTAVQHISNDQRAPIELMARDIWQPPKL